MERLELKQTVYDKLCRKGTIRCIRLNDRNQYIYGVLWEGNKTLKYLYRLDLSTEKPITTRNELYNLVGNDVAKWLRKLRNNKIITINLPSERELER